MRQCKNCGKDMKIGFSAKRVFCSSECYNKFYGAKNQKLSGCAVCGKPLSGKRRTYCSDECGAKGKLIREKDERHQLKAEAQKDMPVKVPKKRGRPKKSTTLAGINELARAEGLSYGQYVGKYGL